MKRRGQSSLEYIVITSAVLIISLIAISITTDFPEFGKDINQKGKRQYWQIADLGISHHAFNSTHAKLKIKNNLDDIIELQEVIIDESLVYSTATNISTQNSEIIEFAFNSDKLRGEPYSHNIKFKYKNWKDLKEYYFFGEATLDGRIVNSFS